MKQHIELVKKWLANPESVSQEELQDNYNSVQEASPWFYSTAQRETMGIGHRVYDVRVGNASYMALKNNQQWASYWINEIEAGL